MIIKKQGLDFAIWANGDVTDFHEDFISEKVIIALDGGIRSLSEWGITPHYLLGDFDSLDEREIKHFQKKGVELINTPDQNLTDLEKAILFADDPAQQAKSIEVLNFQGNRLDHSFASFFFLKKYFKKERPLRLRTMEQVGEYLPQGSYEFDGLPEGKVGVLPFPSAQISTVGLFYDADHLKMDLTGMASIGNFQKEKNFKLDVHEGDVLLFRNK